MSSLSRVTSCTPLSKAEIYNVYHDKPRRYLEVYVSDFLRAIVVDLEDLGAELSLDVYPETITLQMNDIGEATCVEMDSVALCMKNLNGDTLREVARRLRCEELGLVEGHVLLYCLQGCCKEIQLRLRFAARFDDVVEKLCVEDLAQLGLWGIQLS